MKRLHLLMAVIGLALVFTGCLMDNEKDKDREMIVEITIYPETGYGSSLFSDVWSQPLIFSDSDDNEPQQLTDIIFEDFHLDYERGYQYKIKAKKVWMSDPPQDVSSIKYVYIELLSKVKVITDDSEEDIELLVAPHTVKFTPNHPREYDENGTSVKIYNALQAKKTDAKHWMALTKIEGFDFEEGYEYVLNVKKKIKADPYSVSYILLNVKSKILAK